ncbi:nitroreductase family protein [Halobaculum sp. D14]|uniref:nitroreductase family protein n=1 Tax=unclassified Halobaculum TaxID=2640896 RepID=UPI003EBCAB30
MDFEEVVTSRRSVHQYSDEAVDRETLEDIIGQARYAPSSFNLQPWEFLVVQSDENRERLREAANDQEHVTDASAAVVVFGNLDPSAHADAVFGDWLAKDYIPDEETKEYLVDTADGMADLPEAERRVWTTRSSALAAMSLMNAAWNQGVASCPVGGFDADALVDEFDVPDGYEPVLVVTLGYPAEDADDLENPRKYRRPVDEIAHFGEFDPVEETTLADAGGSADAAATSDD